MLIEGYILFDAETGQPVPPLDSTGDPSAMIFDTLADAQESVEDHELLYDITCDIVRVEVRVVPDHFLDAGKKVGGV